MTDKTENPVITIETFREKWRDMGATCDPATNLGKKTVEIHEGNNNFGMFSINVTSITKDTISFKAGWPCSYNYELKRGGDEVCVTETVGGYTDHDGCDWDGTDYNFYLKWE
ncbi:MAG: hypothetical protein IJ776_10150 [Paludibacteraceae bacterium]|nr:hypothetical protein [Paludibacteraceae bacterium]